MNTELTLYSGSIAAGAQAGMGNVAAGSLFATLQSAAMGGYGAATVNGIVQGAAVASSALGLFGGKKRVDGEGGEGGDGKGEDGHDNEGEAKDEDGEVAENSGQYDARSKL